MILTSSFGVEVSQGVHSCVVTPKAERRMRERKALLPGGGPSMREQGHRPRRCSAHTATPTERHWRHC